MASGGSPLNAEAQMFMCVASAVSFLKFEAQMCISVCSYYKRQMSTSFIGQYNIKPLGFSGFGRIASEIWSPKGHICASVNSLSYLYLESPSGMLWNAFISYPCIFYLWNKYTSIWILDLWNKYTTIWIPYLNNEDSLKHSGILSM